MISEYLYISCFNLIDQLLEDTEKSHQTLEGIGTNLAILQDSLELRGEPSLYDRLIHDLSDRLEDGTSDTAVTQRLINRLELIVQIDSMLKMATEAGDYEDGDQEQQYFLKESNVGSLVLQRLSTHASAYSLINQCYCFSMADREIYYQSIVTALDQKTRSDKYLNIVSIGSGCLLGELLISEKLVNAGYTVNWILIDPSYFMPIHSKWFFGEGGSLFEFYRREELIAQFMDLSHQFSDSNQVQVIGIFDTILSYQAFQLGLRAIGGDLEDSKKRAEILFDFHRSGADTLLPEIYTNDADLMRGYSLSHRYNVTHVDSERLKTSSPDLVLAEDLTRSLTLLRKTVDYLTPKDLVQDVIVRTLPALR